MAEAEEAARRAVVAREEVVDALAAAPGMPDTKAAGAACGPGRYAIIWLGSQ
ncbi:hypothetical protein E0500_000445 [Streptomyces sp. KM273126]|uniref:hypothetical protein n=1 Tax=Streptomyces sp. KM273126 TaxID=2545247 RepID=UPI00140450A8|nr:hypothetical protein [Streptomyces sp. KM273126]MBA2805978.1 hypothetical protein [Streptomyces sp. KM273126]